MQAETRIQLSNWEHAHRAEKDATGFPQLAWWDSYPSRQLLLVMRADKRVDGARRASAAAAAKSLQSCPTLCDPRDGSPPGSPVPGILQARTLEWVAISFPNAWKWKVKEKSLSRVRLFLTPWTAVYQAPPSMGFSRQEYWSGVPLPSLKERFCHNPFKPQAPSSVHRLGGILGVRPEVCTTS